MELLGGHDESYNKLPAYCEIVKLTNLKSLCILHGISSSIT